MKLSSKIQSLTDLIEPAVSACGVELWGLEFRPQGKRSLLRVYIDLTAEQKKAAADEKSKSVGVDDCKRVSHQVSGLLDVHDPIAGEYVLEVSSPGWDRQIFTPKQLAMYINETIAFRLITAIEGRRKFTGKLISINDTMLSVEVDNNEIELAVSNIDKASLVYQET